MPEQSNDYRVVVFGAGGVGKSSLVLRFVKGTFRESYIPTIEDTYRQVISCNKNICTLQITDTTGSHQFPAMQRLSISKGHAFILVFSVSSRQSLEELKPIWELIKEIKGPDLSQIPIMLVGNKCDESAELREVSTSEGQAQAVNWGVNFMETSAKTNHNVKQLFQELLNMEKSRNLDIIQKKRCIQEEKNMAVFLHTLMLLANESAIQSTPREVNTYNNYLLEMGVEMNKEKCYGSYGCYNLNPPWTSGHRPVSVFPEDLEKVQPKYHFYSRQHPTEPKYLDLNEPEVAPAADLDSKLPLFIISHGFTDDGQKEWVKSIKDELLKRENCNIIAVDWGRASSPPYTQAVANIRLAGTVTAHLIENISPLKNKRVLENVHCIGHSLGAHLCGYVGYTLQQNFDLTLGRITGLDPAEPHFAKNKPPVRLDRSAAVYVDVIHTDASGFTNAGFGIIEKIGHVDFFPNGGSRQPGCTQSVFEYISLEKSVYNGVKKFIGCNHVRSYEFFIETINPKAPAIGITCPSYEDFLAGKCFSCKKKDTYCIPFGFHSYKTYKSLVKSRALHPKQNLTLYLLTSDAAPFCKNHYKISVYISSAEESKLHRGEVGFLWITVHSTSDGTGRRSNRIRLNDGGYHEPGSKTIYLVPGDAVEKMKSIEVEFEYDTNFMNPLTWRMFSAPRLYISKVHVESLELDTQITVCPKDNKALITTKPQIMIPSYCT